MRYVLRCLIIVLALAAACGSPGSNPTAIPTAPASATASPAPDPCASGQLEKSLKPLNDLLRAFDDAARLAANTPRSQVAGPIAALQALRRQSEDLTVPDCLLNLQAAQLAHMNAVIDTVLAFLGGVSPDAINAGVTIARVRRLDYDTELARLRGVTLTPAPTLLPSPIEPTPTTGASAAPMPTALTATITVLDRANLRAGPGTDFDILGTLEAGQTAKAIARSPAGDWIQIEHPAAPNGIAWVLGSLVQVSVPVEQLPTAMP